MLSDEEKNAFESVKDMFSDVTIKNIDEQSITIYGVAMLDVIKVLTIVEKQSKEIEHQKEKRENQKKELAILNAKQIEFNKLVNTVNSYKGQFKRQEKEIEELKEKDTANLAYYDQIYQNGIYTGQKAVENKIKAKIEEYNEILYYAETEEGMAELKDYEYDEAKYGKKVLQSLLEKE